jgi:hypothetical protein
MKAGGLLFSLLTFVICGTFQRQEEKKGSGNKQIPAILRGR